MKDKEERWSDLMRRAQSSDNQAYEQLLSELSDFLLTYCKKYLGSWCRTDDCVQDCLLALHNARHTYDPSYPFPQFR